MKNISEIPLDQARSVSKQAYEILRAQIIRGAFTPGTRISEAEISRTLAISRQPVREAFIKLRDEGLVEVRPQRGTFVSLISLSAISDSRFIREAVEADIVRLVAAAADYTMITTLNDLIRQQREVSEGALREFIELDEQFHRCLAELAQKANAWKIVANMKAHFDRVRFLSATQKMHAPLIDQHQAVVDAIAQNDPDEAEQAIRLHLKEVLRDLPTLVSLKPDYFVEP